MIWLDLVQCTSNVSTGGAEIIEPQTPSNVDVETSDLNFAIPYATCHALATMSDNGVKEASIAMAPKLGLRKESLFKVRLPLIQDLHLACRASCQVEDA